MQKMNNDVLQSVLEIIRACDSVMLATFGAGEYPDVRHVTNQMNRDATTARLHFLTGNTTPKYAQILKNPGCCLYYYNPENRHALRLYGKLEIINDTEFKNELWRDDFKRFGYSGLDDKSFVILRFMPDEYKFYVGAEMKTGKF